MKQWIIAFIIFMKKSYELMAVPLLNLLSIFLCVCAYCWQHTVVKLRSVLPNASTG